MEMKAMRLMMTLLIGSSVSAMAQLTPMKSQYFQNPYLMNPSMAGQDGKRNLYANVSSQWNEIAGSPQKLSLSASMPVTAKASAGMNIITDQAGLLKRTQAMGSYAYKLPLSESRSICLGISLAWTQDRLDQNAATANGMNDPSLMRYNDVRESSWDGNFGMAYIAGNLEAQFSYLNLNQKRSEKFSTVDYSTFYSSVAYRFALDETFSVKPLVAYRGVNGYDNQWDIAAEWGVFSQDFSLYTMYHSNRSFSGGFGYEYDHKLTISGIFNSEPAAIRGLTGGIFDLVVGYRF